MCEPRHRGDVSVAGAKLLEAAPAIAVCAEGNVRPSGMPQVREQAVGAVEELVEELHDGAEQELVVFQLE